MSATAGLEQHTSVLSVLNSLRINPGEILTALAANAMDRDLPSTATSTIEIFIMFEGSRPLIFLQFMKGGTGGVAGMKMGRGVPQGWARES